MKLTRPEPDMLESDSGPYVYSWLESGEFTLDGEFSVSDLRELISAYEGYMIDNPAVRGGTGGHGVPAASTPPPKLPSCLIRVTDHEGTPLYEGRIPRVVPAPPEPEPPKRTAEEILEEILSWGATTGSDRDLHAEWMREALRLVRELRAERDKWEAQARYSPRCAAGPEVDGESPRHL